MLSLIPTPPDLELPHSMADDLGRDLFADTVMTVAAKAKEQEQNKKNARLKFNRGHYAVAKEGWQMITILGSA